MLLILYKFVTLWNKDSQFTAKPIMPMLLISQKSHCEIRIHNSQLNSILSLLAWRLIAVKQNYSIYNPYRYNNQAVNCQKSSRKYTATIQISMPSCNLYFQRNLCRLSVKGYLHIFNKRTATQRRDSYTFKKAVIRNKSTYTATSA